MTVTSEVGDGDADPIDEDGEPGITRWGDICSDIAYGSLLMTILLLCIVDADGEADVVPQALLSSKGF